MVRRSYGGASRLMNLNRIGVYDRIRQRTRNRRFTLGDIAILVSILVFMLILIPPVKKEKVSDELGQVKSQTEKISKIKVYNPNEALVDEYDLEEYLIGVVAAEMPPDFNEEALKAQAVAARTFAAGRIKGLYTTYSDHFGAHVCTNSKHCQAWISKKRFLEVYGSERDWERVQKAVSDTKNIVMTYSGQLINPLYHSNSGGVTEDIDAVWSNVGAVPYLKSVYSPDDSKYREYEKKTIFSWDEIKKKVKNKYKDAKLGTNPKKDIEVTAYSGSGRVEEIRIGSVKMKGTQFRELMGLRSTNLEFSFPDKKTVLIISKGFGHGVGMSQCGADALGKKGFDFKKILEYYYTGVKVEELTQ